MNQEYLLVCAVLRRIEDSREKNRNRKSNREGNAAARGQEKSRPKDRVVGSAHRELRCNDIANLFLFCVLFGFFFELLHVCLSVEVISLAFVFGREVGILIDHDSANRVLGFLRRLLGLSPDTHRGGGQDYE